MKRLDNVSNLYAAVQLLAPGQYDNEQLFRDAFEGSVPMAETDDSQEMRSAFYGKLVSILRQSMQDQPDGSPQPPPALHQRVTRDTVARVFPSAFLQLKAGERLLLFLSVVERYDADSIAEIIGFEPEHAWRQLETVRNKLDAIIHEMVGPSLQRLLPVAHIPPDWIDGNITSFVRDHLDRPASTVQTFVEARLSPGSTSPSVAAAASRVRDEDAQARSNKPFPFAKIGIAACLIFFTGLTGFVLSRFFEEPIATPGDIMELSLEKAADASSVLTTTDAVQAEEFIRSHFNRILKAPELHGLRLAGVGSTEIIDGIRVPSLLYEDIDSNEPMVVLGYTYALLDKIQFTVDVPDDIYQSVEAAGVTNVRDVKGRNVIFWREADDIMIAVLPKKYTGSELLF